MNFIRFPVAGTNIFPIVNSKSGGQLLTEWNLRSRESVATNGNIKYYCGPSYAHGEDDFAIRIQTDGAGTAISTTAIEILPGRAVVNGHFIDSLTTVVVDLAEANAQAKIEGSQPLNGQLSIGLKAMYSTVQTIAGSLLVENEDNLFEGLQIVILPSDQFILPSDPAAWEDESKVTAHLKLGSFFYSNGTITTVKNNYPEKCQCLSAERIGNIDQLISDTYITKTGLDPNKLYVFAGKGTDPEKGKDTWCNAVPSLIVWDQNPTTQSEDPGKIESEFVTSSTDGKISLLMPHMQVDGYMDGDGNHVYYSPKIIDIPIADFNSETSGTVNAAYTKNIKDIRNVINNLYNLPAGKQRAYIDLLTDRNELPAINPSWSVGDYIVVRQDNTVVGEVGIDLSTLSAPSTLYVVLPSYVQAVQYKESNTTGVVPESLTGVKLGSLALSAANGDSVPNTTEPETYNTMWGLPSDTLRGQVGVDYFVASYTALPIDDADPVTTNYYYSVSANVGPNEYSSPGFLTGGVPLASTEMIGGFLNVPETQRDYGYVYLDESGHLRLLDYALLRSGTLAYQLGQDYTFGPGITNTEIQTNLDEYINDRVAFPNAQKAKSTNPNVINITLELSEVADDSDDVREINIKNIDSRFGTSVYLTITGTATSNTTINISDCQKIRINNNIAGTPIINLYRCGLYYDANVIDYIRSCKRDANSYPTGFYGISDFTLWYERYEESQPNLIVDNMTVIETYAPVITEEIDYWSEDAAPNDNHFLYALQSITFSGDGSIIRCSLYMKNQTTNNVQVGLSVLVGKFQLPQGAGLQYPTTSMTRQIKVDGTFVTAYTTQNPSGYMVMQTSFTALTNTYDVYDESNSLSGSIAFYTNAQYVENYVGIDGNESAPATIDAWDSNSFHTFTGSVIG